MLDRNLILEYLEQHWGKYNADFHEMSPEGKTEFLHRQGYRRFADLLVHFNAWWEVGMRVIETYRLDPDYQPPAVDVDAFNAAAVERVRELTEEQVVQLFEETRGIFIELVNRLSDDDFRNLKLAKQLEIELVNHLEEHAI